MYIFFPITVSLCVYVSYLPTTDVTSIFDAYNLRIQFSKVNHAPLPSSGSGFSVLER